MHLLSPEGLHAVARDREQRARTAADDYRQKRLVEGSRVPGGKPVPMTRQVSQPMRRDTEFAIETAGLVTAFNETRAVDRIDQTVPTGGVYGLPGPSGAGKTTVIPDADRALVPTRGR